jgi:hypothetical protein
MVDEYSVMTLVLRTEHFTFYYPDNGAWFICKISKMTSHEPFVFLLHTIILLIASLPCCF